MKICIISDLHCKYRQLPNEKSETFLISNSPRYPESRHPVAAFLNLIDKNPEISADLLVCPGDLGDKADEQGIISSWSFLHEIKAKLGAQFLVSVPGNHDINSRKIHDKEPFDFIKYFHKNFPIEDASIKSKFWDQGFCFYVLGDVVFLLFNSVHNHTDPTKGNQSLILPEMLESIEETFKTNSTYRSIKYKIALFHHHPIQHSNINNFTSLDLIDKGDVLIDLLNKLGFDLVLHGHKHQPRLVEYNGLPIFAAGSFSSFSNLQGTGINNMFHIIELKDDNRKGIIYSWEYDIVRGWTQVLNPKFPPKVGFGSNMNINDIGKEINKIFESNFRKAMLYDSVIDAIHDVEFLIPEKLIRLNEILRTEYKIKVSPEYPLEPNKISEYIY